MAIGTVTTLTPDAAAIELLASATATNGAPTGSAGLSANALAQVFGTIPRKLRVAVVSTAGSGTMTCTLTLWMRLGSLGWVQAQKLNAGSAIAETGTDTIGYSETVDTLECADRFYLEIAAIAGTNTAVTGYLALARQYG